MGGLEVQEEKARCPRFEAPAALDVRSSKYISFPSLSAILVCVLIRFTNEGINPRRHYFVIVFGRVSGSLGLIRPTKGIHHAKIL